MPAYTIADFARKHKGLRVIARRHAVYNKPVLGLDALTMAALIYSRTIDPQLLGLSAEGMEQMYNQGELLAEMGLVPDRIVTGIDLRNWEGGMQTVAAIKAKTGNVVPCHRSPAVTYPYYDAMKTVEVYEKYGDQAVHAYLSEQPGTEGLWTESAADFMNRIEMSVASVAWPGITLFDLNFEQMTFLHFHLVEHLRQVEIPFGPDAWCPKNGGGIVIANDDAVGEFHPDLTMVIKIVS